MHGSCLTLQGLAYRRILLPVTVTTSRDSPKPPRQPPPSPPPLPSPLPPPRLLLLVELAQEQSTLEISSWRNSCAVPVPLLLCQIDIAGHRLILISSNLGGVPHSGRPPRSSVTITKNFLAWNFPVTLQMAPPVPQPGPARLKRSAGPDEWLEAARNCKYLSEHHMKQLCEIVKEFMMEGQSEAGKMYLTCFCSCPLQNQTYNLSLHP